jgi:hypothetical protein
VVSTTLPSNVVTLASTTEDANEKLYAALLQAHLPTLGGRTSGSSGETDRAASEKGRKIPRRGHASGYCPFASLRMTVSWSSRGRRWRIRGSHGRRRDRHPGCRTPIGRQRASANRFRVLPHGHRIGFQPPRAAPRHDASDSRPTGIGSPARAVRFRIPDLFLVHRNGPC